ncbi:hypothetical protein AB0E94_11120, partial [Actinoplanes sp. NPDC026670]
MTEVLSSEAFAVPSAWKRFVLPRRGDATSAPKPRAADVKAAGELLTAFDGDVRTALRHRLIAGDLAEAGHGYLAAGPDVTPLGAAVVARGIGGALPWLRRDELTAFADLWRARHGLAFAAAATVELAGFYLGSSPSAAAITRSVPDSDANGFGTRTAIRMAYQLRRAVVAAPPEEYAAVVTALGGSRGPALAQQALVSVIAPDEAAWADDICARVSALGGREALKGLLLTVVSAEPLASRLAGQLSAWAVLSESERIYTFTATLGPAAAPALTGWLDAPVVDAQDRRKLLGLLAAVGGDAALTALIERAGRPDVPGPEMLGDMAADGIGDLLALPVRRHQPV